VTALDPVRPYRRAVEPDDQVRHRDPCRRRLHRGDCAAVYEDRRDPPDLSGDDRARPRAQKTIFLARYLRSRTLQCEIHQGLNVVESWSRANSVIFYGKSGDLATNRRDEREMSLLCLRILRAALVYVNTLMLQDILADLDWEDVLTTEDVRGLSRCGRRTKPDRMAGQVHSLTGDANRYNGSRRTRHVDYVMVRS
jgi:Tn3 transposase DDE domain